MCVPLHVLGVNEEERSLSVTVIFTLVTVTSVSSRLIVMCPHTFGHMEYKCAIMVWLENSVTDLQPHCSVVNAPHALLWRWTGLFQACGVITPPAGVIAHLLCSIFPVHEIKTSLFTANHSKEVWILFNSWSKWTGVRRWLSRYHCRNNSRVSVWVFLWVLRFPSTVEKHSWEL